jgi:hypothetical protein
MKRRCIQRSTNGNFILKSAGNTEKYFKMVKEQKYVNGSNIFKHEWTSNKQMLLIV